MNRFSYLVAILLLLSATHGLLAAESRPPNILHIMLDDSGYYEMSALGHPMLETPHMDRLMAEGMRFTCMLAGGTVCAPTRCALMTGRHPGHMTVVGNSGQNAIRADEPTIASMLKSAGYATGGFGKWGLGARGTVGVPEKHGFDVFFGYYDQVHAHSYYAKYLIRNSQEFPLKGNSDKTQGEYSAYTCYDQTRKFIRENKDKPFYCYVPTTLPHGFFEIPETDPSWARFNDKPWPQQARARAAMLHLADRQVQGLVELLRELGLEDNTLVIVTGDNGGYEAFRSKENPRGFFKPNMDPKGKATFRGGKGSLYEGGLRVAAFARWPGHIKAGTVTDLPCTFSDMMPTFAEITGAKLPEVAEGVSFAPTLLGREGQRLHEWMYWGGNRRWALRMGTWKALGGAKGECQLYDLRTDIGEEHDVAAEHADIVARMKAIAEKACDPGRMGEIHDQELVKKDRKAKGMTTGRL